MEIDKLAEQDQNPSAFSPQIQQRQGATMDLEQRIKELERRLEEMERMSELDAPFDKATARRELLIQIAVEAADSILMGFSDMLRAGMNRARS